MTRGLAASLAAVVALTACGGNGRDSGKPPTSGTATPTTAAPMTQAAETKKWIDLNVGDCLADLPSADPSVVTVSVVDCVAVHQAEVYLRAPVVVNAAIDEVATKSAPRDFPTTPGDPSKSVRSP